MCFCVDDGNPVPAILAKVNILCKIDEAYKFRAIQFGGVVDVIVVIEKDLAIHDVMSPFSDDIGYRVGATDTCRTSKFCSGIVVKLRNGLTFQVFRFAFFILSRYCMNHIPLFSIVIGYPDMGKLTIA